MLHYFGYFAAIFIGLSLGIMGGGGSILTVPVPVLVYLIGVNPVLSTAYSLFIVGSTSLVGAVSYARKGPVSVPTALVFLATSLAAVFMTRKFLLPAIPHELFTMGRIVFTKDLLVAFAVLMVAAATSMIRSRQAEEMLEDDEKHQHSVNYVLILTVGAVVGLLTGFVGAGGGFLIIPALVLFARLPMKLAVGTSLAIIALNSLIGFTGDLSAGRVMDWPFLAGFLAFALGGIVLGTYLARFIPGARLKPAFGWFTLAMGTFILTKELLFR